MHLSSQGWKGRENRNGVMLSRMLYKFISNVDISGPLGKLTLRFKRFGH